MFYMPYKYELMSLKVLRKRYFILKRYYVFHELLIIANDRSCILIFMRWCVYERSFGRRKNRTSFSATVYLSCILMTADGQAATELPDNLIFAR